MLQYEPYVSVQAEDFCLSSEQRSLHELLQSADGEMNVGALASFVGLVRAERDPEYGPLRALQIEHYAGMTERSLLDICAQAQRKWQLITCRVIHRVGRIAPGHQIVMVMVAAMHRGDAFAGCEFIMDYLKTSAPFWKKACYTGGQRWVAARAHDQQRSARWQG
ncbi:MAG: molybdenum cofactor biosynthesis protein MoaE [Pseudomonadales bacterium]